MPRRVWADAMARRVGSLARVLALRRVLMLAQVRRLRDGWRVTDVSCGWLRWRPGRVRATGYAWGQVARGVARQ